MHHAPQVACEARAHVQGAKAAASAASAISTTTIPIAAPRLRFLSVMAARLRISRLLWTCEKHSDAWRWDNRPNVDEAFADSEESPLARKGEICADTGLHDVEKGEGEASNHHSRFHRISVSLLNSRVSSLTCGTLILLVRTAADWQFMRRLPGIDVSPSGPSLELTTRSACHRSTKVEERITCMIPTRSGYSGPPTMSLVGPARDHGRTAYAAAFPLPSTVIIIQRNSTAVMPYGRRRSHQFVTIS
jgi:hypothetical protein